MDSHNRQPYSAAVQTSLEPTFFGKVMMCFALAILASAAGVWVTTHYFLEFFLQAPALMYVLFAVELILVFTSRFWSQRAPLNRILFGAFAFITGVTIAPLIAVVAQSPGGALILAKALGATTLMFTATAFIGWTTRRNLSGMRGFLLMALIGMIVVGIIGIFVPWSNTTEMIYSGIGIILFSAYTMYDFQKLKSYPADRYIDAAMALYLNMFNLFLFILRFILASRD